MMEVLKRWVETWSPSNSVSCQASKWLEHLAIPTKDKSYHTIFQRAVEDNAEKYYAVACIKKYYSIANSDTRSGLSLQFSSVAKQLKARWWGLSEYTRVLGQFFDFSVKIGNFTNTSTTSTKLSYINSSWSFLECEHLVIKSWLGLTLQSTTIVW